MAKQKKTGTQAIALADPAPETNGQANEVLRRLARLIGRQMARENKNLFEDRKPPDKASCPRR